MTALSPIQPPSRRYEKLRPAFLDEIRKRFESSFFFACGAVFEQGFRKSWISPTIHMALCDELSDFQRNRRLGIILPRGWLKSTFGSVYYPLWRAMMDEEFTSLAFLNTATNARKKLRAQRSILLQNELLRQLYPWRMPDSSCSISQDAISLPRHSSLSDETFTVAGVGTQTTSRHVRLIVEDDTLAPEVDHMTGLVMVPTKEQVEKAIGSHRASHFLLSDFARDQRLVIGTRWLQRDLFAEIIATEPEYRIIERAAFEDDKGRPSMSGTPVYPERFSQKVLDEIRHTVGEYMFQALMMNSPMASTTMIFHEHDFQFYEVEPRSLLTFTTVDPAPSDQAASGDPDYNVVMTCGFDFKTGNIYVLDYTQKRCNPGELIRDILSHAERFNPVKIGIESVGYQATLKYWLGEAMNKKKVFYNVEKLPASRARKTERIRGLQPIVEAHRLFLRKDMRSALTEFLTFDKGAHDDIIDSISMQLGYWLLSEQERDETLKSRSKDDPRSADWIFEELEARSRPSGEFPYDSLAPALSGARRGDYIYN